MFSAPTEQVATSSSNLAECHTQHLGDNRAQVDCQQRGNAISLCGHGLLSAAAFWRDSNASVNTLHMGNSRFEVDSEGDTFWVAMPLASLQEGNTHRWMIDRLGKAPVRVEASGPDQGYLVLEYTDLDTLMSLTAPDGDLTKHTQRAIITTCLLDTTSTQTNIALRYFAPQYGNPEDSATGSALRVLAAYWRKHCGAETLCAYQCSPRGGLLLSRLDDKQVWIGGLVEKAREPL